MAISFSMTLFLILFMSIAAVRIRFALICTYSGSAYSTSAKWLRSLLNTSVPIQNILIVNIQK